MDDKNEVDKIGDIMLPGFRFHPTDEELVGFYLKSKIQQRPLAIELIKQVDIYKHDPWDLPNLASSGEKEWYFYCPRDRKYRNSVRPNRVTGAGFWKATGTDRPIYSSNGSKCIGLKKSLVFYRGRAAKGIKTDWMMHEFRLPCKPDEGPPKKLLDKNLPPNNTWAICRIFKKANSMAQRALSPSWVSSLPETTSPDMFTQVSENMSCTTETSSALQFCNDLQQNSTASYSANDNPSFYKPFSVNALNGGNHNGLVLLSHDMFGPNAQPNVDVYSMLYNISPGDDTRAFERIDFGVPQQQQFNNFSMSSPDDITAGEDDAGSTKDHRARNAYNQWGNVQPLGFPVTLSSSLMDAWNPNLPWDSPHVLVRYPLLMPQNKCYATKQVL